MKRRKPMPPRPVLPPPPPDPKWEAAKRKAAVICLKQTLPLIGVDVPVWGECAESMSLDGARKRFETVMIAVGVGVSEALLTRLVMGEGPHGSDRLTAIWWTRLRLMWTDLFYEPHKSDPDAWFESKVFRDLDEMVDAGTMHPDARQILRGTEDQFLWQRIDARKEAAKFYEELRALADSA